MTKAHGFNASHAIIIPGDTRVCRCIDQIPVCPAVAYQIVQTASLQSQGREHNRSTEEQMRIPDGQSSPMHLDRAVEKVAAMRLCSRRVDQTH